MGGRYSATLRDLGVFMVSRSKIGFGSLTCVFRRPGDNGTRRNTRRCCTSRRGGNSRPGPTCGATLVWNMFHFASDGRNEGGQPGIIDKGLVRRDRSVRKDASTGTRSTGHRRRRCTSPADAGRSAPLPADQPPVEQVLQLRQPRLRIWRRRPHGRQLYIRGWGGG
jgi:hypothetical protein